MCSTIRHLNCSGWREPKGRTAFAPATGITTPDGVVTFTDAEILMTLIGDTDNVVANPEFEDDGFVVPAGIFFINPSVPPPH